MLNIKQPLNINADTAAGAIAEALHADQLLLLTDVSGVLDSAGHVLPQMSPQSVADFIDCGGVRGGMIPKLQAAVSAAKSGVGRVTILDGRAPHCIKQAMCGSKIHGTEIQST